MSAPDAILPEALLRELETTAVELAHLAGAEIMAAISRPFAVQYKGGDTGNDRYRNPVSEVDHNTEILIRARLAGRFPDHDIVGEEIDARPGAGHDFLWALDPIDGTANFVNGFPLFAASIGVLHRGAPVAGAVWCSTTHALRPGVYHARRGHSLYFDGQAIAPRDNSLLRRHLAGEPRGNSVPGLPWDSRLTGSAAIECAFVAAGLLRVSRLEWPNLWDVAGGVVLVQAAGGEVRIGEAGQWRPFDGFGAPAVVGGGDPGAWRGAMVLGQPDAVARYCDIQMR